MWTEPDACRPRRYGGPMLLRRAAAPLAILAAVTLAGCALLPPMPTPDAEPARAPSSSPPSPPPSDAQLSEIIGDYEHYLEVSGTVLQDGGRAPERLRDLVGDEQYAAEVEAFERQLSEHRTTDGALALLHAEPSTLATSSDADLVLLDVCLDASSITFVATSQNRTTVTTVDPLIESTAAFRSVDGTWLLEDVVRHPPGSVC